jgi:KDO2-lipid IV(A) lauroyltransferase
MTKKEFCRWMAYGLGRVAIELCDFAGRIMPLGFLYAMGRFMGWAGYAFSGQHKRIAIDSLTRAFGKEKTPVEIRRICRECFNSMAYSAVEFFMFMKHPERVRRFVEIEGVDNLKRALAEGKGVVAVSAHFGSFPLLLTRLAQEGFRVNAVMRHMRDAKLDELFEKKRVTMHVGSIYTQPRQTCVTQSLDVLRDNQVLFVQLDQNFGTGGVFVDFFGVKAATATGPVVFSMRTGAPLVPMFIYRLDGPRHRIVIEPAMAVRPDGTKEERLLDAVERLTVLIERYIRKYPHEWAWIHKRWKARPKEEKGL